MHTKNVNNVHEPFDQRDNVHMVELWITPYISEATQLSISWDTVIHVWKNQTGLGVVQNHELHNVTVHIDG